jgi:hypothetical protein
MHNTLSLQALIQQGTKLEHELKSQIDTGKTDQAKDTVDSFLNIYNQILTIQLHKVNPAAYLPNDTPPALRKLMIKAWSAETDASDFFLENDTLKAIAAPLKDNIEENKDNASKRLTLFRTCLKPVLETLKQKIQESFTSKGVELGIQAAQRIGGRQVQPLLDKRFTNTFSTNAPDIGRQLFKEKAATYVTLTQEVTKLSSAALTQDNCYVDQTASNNFFSNINYETDSAQQMMLLKTLFGIKNEWKHNTTQGILSLQAALKMEDKTRFTSKLEENKIPEEAYAFYPCKSREDQIQRFKFKILNTDQFFYHLYQADVFSEESKSQEPGSSDHEASGGGAAAAAPDSSSHQPSDSRAAPGSQGCS